MRSNRHLVTALTVALALGAAAAPAFAQSSRWVVRPNPDEQTAAALATFNASNHSSPTAPAPEVRPNPDE